MGGLVNGVKDLFGGAQNNAGFVAQNPVNSSQLFTGNDEAHQGVTSAQALMQALGAQNGIQNQSNVFNQLQGVANGTGPNPAQAMLNQQTGQNIASQGALMAGQRGVGANPGLIARQIANQGAGIQQNAVGQAATMQAQQQLGALGQLGGLASQQVGQQQQATGLFGQLAGNQQAQLLNANQGANAINAGVANNNANNTSKTIGGLFNGIGGALAGRGGATPAGGATTLAGGSEAGGLGAGTMLVAEGGKIVGAPNPKIAAVAPQDRFSSKILEPHVQHIAQIYHPEKFAGGGQVQALVSPGEVYLPPEKAKAVAKDDKNPIKEGEKIPGKPKVKGNSYANDTVPKKLESGGVVIPNSIMQSDDPVGNASEFVRKLMEKNNGKEHGEFKEALKKAISNRKAS